MNPKINPKWIRLTKTRSIAEAIRKYYKPDRLWDIMGEQVQDVRKDLARDEGLTVLASRHESVTGRGLWIHEDGSGYVIYQSEK